MLTALEMQRKFATVFEEEQATVLATLITEAYSELVKTSDFNELKAIVKDLAEAQKRTELQVKELATSQKELAEAQKRTELRVGELAEAQKRTEHQIQLLTKAVNELRGEVGGLSTTFSYAFENETYRLLSKVLQATYGIQLTEKLIRTHLGGKEINILGKGTQAGKEIWIVGEVKLRLDERRGKQKAIFDDLAEKARAVKAAYDATEIVKILVTHHARPGFLKEAKEREVIVVQSFEW
ncbi:hypothetical protein HYR99_36165 [Candidatus Poribacteria bacterium]|nr:hypothetical protein [Candidatus Poribacteria bacterium]